MKTRIVLKMADPLGAVAALTAQIRGEVEKTLKSEARGQMSDEDKYKTNRYQGKEPVTRGYRQLEMPHQRNPWREKCRREKMVKPPPKAERGEVPLWEFVQAEMTRWRESKNSVHGWIKHGRYPWLKIRKATRRVVFVKVPKSNPAPLNMPRPGEIPLKEFVAREVERGRVDPVTIHMRLACGGYPGLQFRRVNKRTVFVTIMAEGGK